MLKGFFKYARGSHFGRGFEAGIAEGLGFQRDAVWKDGMRMYDKGGFLGSTMPARTAEEIGAKRWARIGGLASLAFIGYSAYSGYQEGGVLGAVKNVGTDLAYQAVGTGVYNTVIGSIGSLPVIGAAATVGAAYGYYKLGEAGQTYAKNLRKLEMGTDIHDNFGTIATMRQRSLNAIQNSHLNGRMALGNEASAMHVSYRR